MCQDVVNHLELAPYENSWLAYHFIKNGVDKKIKPDAHSSYSVGYYFYLTNFELFNPEQTIGDTQMYDLEEKFALAPGESRLKVFRRSGGRKGAEIKQTEVDYNRLD